MAYQGYQIDPRSFLPDMVGGVQAGMDMYERIKRARMAEEEANERRAATAKEFMYKDADLKFRMDQEKRLGSAGKRAAMELAQKYFAAENYAAGEAVLREAGISGIGSEEQFDEAPAPAPAAPTPQSPAIS